MFGYSSFQKRLGLGWLCLGLSQFVWSAEDIPESPPLVITRDTPVQSTTPASVRVITRDQIDSSGSRTLVDVLKGQAGVQIRDTVGDGNRTTVSVRGFGENAGNNTLIMVDGRRLNNPSTQSPDLNSVSLDNIERIEVLRGAGTVLYGDQAVGGVINIITRRPVENELYVETTRGSHDLEAFQGNAYHNLGHGFSAYLSGLKRTNNNYRQHNHANYGNGMGRLRFDHDTGYALYEYQTINDDLKLPGYLNRDEAREHRRASYKKNGNGKFDSLTKVQRLTAEQDINDDITANFDYNYRDAKGKGRYNSRYDPFDFHQNTRVNAFLPRLSGRVDTAWGQSDWLVGYDRTISDYHFKSAFEPTKFRQNLSDFYGQWVQPLNDAVNVTAGYRQSRVHDRKHSTHKDNSNTRGRNSFGISWQIDSDWRTFLKREQVLRWANVDENAYVAPGVEFLRPQLGESWESGLSWTQEKRRVELTLYQLRLKDELMYDALADNSKFGAGAGANINANRTHHTGVMLEAEQEITLKSKLGGQYSYTNSKYKSGRFSGNEVPWVSKNTAGLNWRYQVTPWLESYLESVYTGARYLSSDEGHNQERMGAYNLINWAWITHWQSWTGKLRVDNLFDRKYQSYGVYSLNAPGSAALYPAARRQFELTLGYQF